MVHQVKPSGAWLTINRACNLRCKWCYAEETGYQPKAMMSLELAKNLVNLLKDLGISHTQLIGGEPTLWPNLLELNRLTNQLGMKTTIVTNALRFGEDAFWEEYKQNPNSSVGISVKASDSLDLLKMAGSKHFSRLSLGLKRALEFFQCGVGLTYNTFYTEKLKDLARFAIDSGAKSIKIDFCSTVFESGKAVSDYMVEPRELVTNIMRDYDTLVEITGGKLVFEMNMPLCLWPSEFIQHLIKQNRITSVCHVQKRQGIIFDTDGRVVICNGLFDYPLGKYGEEFDSTSSLLNFLNQQEIGEYYAQINSLPSMKCQSCQIYSQCGGGCPLKWAVYDPDKIIPGYQS